jgi:hypothetical protein
MSFPARLIIEPSAMAILPHVITGSANYQAVCHGNAEQISNMVNAIQQGGPGCADSETESARGVEESVSAPQSQFLPPQLKKSTRKRMQEKISNMVNAIQQGGPGCADSETESARGVEEHVSALQSQVLPPQLKKSTRKRMPEKISNMVDTIQQGGPGCADSETEADFGVEGSVSAPQSQFPPPQLKKSTRERSCKPKRKRQDVPTHHQEQC